jgi:hypothetical protein
MKRVMRVLPHLSIVFAGLLLALFVVDYFNGSMGFLDGDVARIVIVLVSLTSIVDALALIALQRNAERAGSGS